LSKGEAWLRFYAAHGHKLAQLFQQQRLAEFHQRMSEFFESKK
jgi:pyrroloquinoline quinone (PQQ) biosynthesis protein C